MTLPISIVIPCFKQEQYLNLAVESAANQSDDITIVYDGDSDGGDWGDYPGYINSFAVGNPYRAGVCFARNIGIESAKHDLILCLDADDRLYPDALQRLFDAWKPGTFVYGRYTEIDELENVIRDMDAPPPAMIFRKNLTYSTFLFSRDDWQKVGGYDPNYEFGDEDFAFQVALVDSGVKPIRYEGAPIFKRMIHEHSRTERAIKYFPMVLEMLREKYPGTMNH